MDVKIEDFAPQILPAAIIDEATLRVELAACYRLVAMAGMDDTIFTHISARVPGPAHHFLINPYGMTFDEVTASSLVKIDLQGNKVEASEWPVNPPGFVIHSAIHAARADVLCVLHTHTIAGMAVAASAEGLLPLSQHALEFHNRVAYHEYEGLAVDLDERARLVRDLGAHHAMILRNHGLLTTGATIAAAFSRMYYLEQSCRVQVAVQSSGAALSRVDGQVAERAARQLNPAGPGKGERLWRAMRRRLDRVDTSYRN
jgi:ribulose-5-phosphate 4-epimerase/fuculose-1-phosphate aldolase